VQVTSGSKTGTANVSVIVNLTALASANPDTIIKGDSSQLNVTTTGGNGTYSYVWTSIPSGFLSTKPSPVVHPVQPTQYIVHVNSGSQSVNDTTAVFVIFPTGIDADSNGPGDVLITPNPTKGIFNVTFKGIKTREEISLINSSGETVYMEKYDFEKSKNYNFSNLAAGLYFFRVGNKARKLVIY